MNPDNQQNENQQQRHPQLQLQQQLPEVKFDQSSIERELNLSVIQKKELDKFIPKNFPKFLDNNGRIPLRRRIYQNKKILKTVLTKPKKGVYMCNHCDQIFNNLGELLDHFDEFNVKRPHKCNVDDCPWKIIGFNRLRQLQRHKASVHSTEKNFKCKVPNCNKEFARVDLLNRHIKSVHENKASRFNRKMTKESLSSSRSSTRNISNPYPNSPIIPDNLFSNDESIGGGEESTSTSESRNIASTSASEFSSQTHPSTDSINQQRRSSQYKHTIKFLTNSDD